MEERTETASSDTTGESLTVVEAVRRLAAFNARSELNSEAQLLLFLQSWWSRTYNRPLKDPLLLEYSLEELLYEFYDRIERQKAEEERVERDDVKIEEEKEKAAEDWAEKMEREEMEQELREAAAQGNVSKSVDPTKDPGNIQWMEEQLKAHKEKYGESFGEDIEESF